MTDVKHCCNQPPRLLEGPRETFKYVCMNCGIGLQDQLFSVNLESAKSDWRQKKSSWYPALQGPATVLLKELNDAHDVLRNLASTLGAGGYNADVVDAKVFAEKIHFGIDSSLKYYTDKISQLEQELVKADENFQKWTGIRVVRK